MTFLPLSVKRRRGEEEKKNDLKSKILLDMLDFPIKSKGFQSGSSCSIQKWEGLGLYLHGAVESDSTRLKFISTPGLSEAPLRGGSQDSFPSSTCGTEGPPGAAIPPTQSPRADAFPSFITSLPPSLDVSPGSRSGGEGGWR